MDLSWRLPYGFSSAFTAAMEKEIDMKHNKRPPLVCEGSCSDVEPTVKHHTFLTEFYNREEDQWEQYYKCDRCDTPRRYGATICRITEKGESN